MTKKSSQELLNEILLHMKYDSSLTLSENKEMLMEQNTFYYDNLGNLKGGGPISVPTGARMASKLFPNLNQSQYPKKVLPTTAVPKPSTQQTQVPTVNRNPKYQQLLRDYNLPADLENKKDVKAIIANRLVSGEYEEFKNKLKTIYPDLYTKLQPQVTPKQKPKVGPKVDSRSYSDATRIAPGALGTPTTPLASDEQMAAVRFLTPKRINVGFNDEFEVPGTSELLVWNQNDHNDLKSFANSVTFKSGNINDWAIYISTPSKQNETSKNYNMPIGDVKGFKFKYREVEFTFKRSVTSDSFLNEFGTLYNGQYLMYNKLDFLKPSFWEEYGSSILLGASFALAFLGPETWPLILAQSGLDVASANLELKQGNNEGAKLALLLGLVPFLGKLAIKVPTSEINNLAQKFVNATTKQQVDSVVASLSKEELKTLQSLYEIGDINKLKSSLSSLGNNQKEVFQTIKKQAKDVKGFAPAQVKQIGLTVVGASAAVASMWSNITQEELSKLKRKDLLNQIIKTTASLSKTKEDQEKTLSLLNKKIPNQNNEFVNWVKQLQKKYEDEQFKEFTDSAIDVISELESGMSEELVGSDSTKIINDINNMGNILLR
jgi:hypothetical protein